MTVDDYFNELGISLSAFERKQFSSLWESFSGSQLTEAGYLELCKPYLSIFEKDEAHPLLVKGFLYRFLHYLLALKTYVSMDNVEQLDKNAVVSFESLADYVEQGKALLSSCAFVKLNGGLGTTMGCQGPKSLIELRPNYTFLDAINRHFLAFRNKYQISMPFYLVNSFFTHDAICAFLEERDMSAICLEQNRIPRICDHDKQPVAIAGEQWTPPGHGDLFLTLKLSGALETFKKSGINYIFVSNSDNISPMPEPEILGYMKAKSLDMVMEATTRTKQDIKGGPLVNVNGKLTVLERAQVSTSDEKERLAFEDYKWFNLFNTNNLWFCVEAIETYLEQLCYKLPPIMNFKNVRQQTVVQLETAMGAAVNLFEKSGIVHVPRYRFFPVKSQADLERLKDDM